MAAAFGLHPFLIKLYADGGYQGPQFQRGLKQVMRQVDTQIVKRSNQLTGVTALPNSRIVEHTIAWLNRCCRLAKGWNAKPQGALAFLRLASIRLMLRKLCQKTKSFRMGFKGKTRVSPPTKSYILPAKLTEIGAGPDHARRP